MYRVLFPQKIYEDFNSKFQKKVRREFRFCEILRKLLAWICCYYTIYTFFVSVKMFRINEEKFLNDEHYPDILVTFMSKTEHFSGENGAFRRSILRGNMCMYIRIMYLRIIRWWFV